MVGYNFDLILGQRVSFAPTTDAVRFESAQAADVSFTVSGVTLLATTRAGTAIFDATPLLTSTSLGLFTPNNSFFSGLSVLAVGDLTTSSTLDGGANIIDFTTNTLLMAALNANNQANGLDGNDSIIMTGSSGNNVLFGGSGADSIVAGSGNNTIYGGNGLADSTDGADRITVGGGNNIIYGNAGADAVVFSAPTQSGNLLRFWGGIGADSITANNAPGRFEIYGGTDNDLISLPGASANNTLYGGDGNDTINLANALGDNTIYGGDSFADTSDGGDLITLGNGNSLVFANAGADTVIAAASSTKSATIYLGLGADSLTSATANGTYLIYGGNDADSINLTNHFGDATIYGGSGISDSTDGSDTIIGSSSGNNLIFGNAGADKITVRPGANQSATVYAGAGNDTITAAAADSSAQLSLYGNGGDNKFELNFSAGRPITHLYDYGFGTNLIAITLGGGASAADLSVSQDSTQTILRNGSGEQIFLGGFKGNFTSANFDTSNDSVLLTNFGNPAATLAGTDKNDQLIAGQSGDTLTAGGGTDLLIGGGGNDRFNFASANFTLADSVRGGGGTDTLNIGTPGTAIADSAFEHSSSIETLRLESGDFGTNGLTLGTLASAAGIRTLDAASSSKANVNLSSMTAGITYLGASAEDTVLGSNFADSISGKAGADLLQGNRGADTLTGGDGNDIFVYSQGEADGSDTITDMDFGTATTFKDRLQFNAGGLGYNLGNQNNVVDGAIITSVTSAGAGGTELIILKSIGIATSSISSVLDTINADVLSNRGALNLFFDSTEQKVVMYYDINGSASGGHAKLITFSNLSTITALDNVDFTDFVFV